MSMQLTSPDFINSGKIPEKFTCDGDNTRPEFRIGGIPVGARSLSIVLDDPDAPSGTFTHWIVWNIPITDKIPSDTLPEGSVEGLNSAGTNKYIGPCPPKGTHTYVTMLYALDTTLDKLDGTRTDKRALLDAMTGHIIATSELTGLYCRRENQ
ncbi:YbhB/YbcL family Raf kinase inhibitor-like protein [Candidatus Parcubacteria bacterium]|nr:YbhB/YbcL family Raf kinase inhibitor-like protein [Candidatus Parcubacteria bacterium]